MARFYTGAGYQGDDAGERFTQAFGQSRLAKLLGDYYQTGDADLAQIAKYNPEAAGSIRQEQQQSHLAKLLGDAYSAPEDQRQGIIGQIMGRDADMGMKAAKLFDPRFAQAAASGVQSTYVDDQGRRVAIMRDGTVQVLGNNAPNNQIIDTGNGFYGVNKGSLSAAPVQVGGQQVSAPTMQAGAGEVPFAIDPSLPPDVQASIRANPQQWGAAGDGAVMQVPQQLRKVDPPKFQSRQYSPQEVQGMGLPPGTVAYTGEDGTPKIVSKPEQRTVTMTAQERRDLNTLRRRVPELQAMPRRIKRLSDAVDALGGGMVNTGPLDQYVMKMTPKGNELEQSVAQIMPLLQSLTRVPGVGSQSDWEGRLNMMQLPSLGNHPEVNKRAIAELNQFITDLSNAYTDAIQSYEQPGQGSQQQAPASGGLSPQEQQELDALRARFGRK